MKARGNVKKIVTLIHLLYLAAVYCVAAENMQYETQNQQVVVNKYIYVVDVSTTCKLDNGSELNMNVSIEIDAGNVDETSKDCGALVRISKIKAGLVRGVIVSSIPAVSGDILQDMMFAKMKAKTPNLSDKSVVEENLSRETTSQDASENMQETIETELPVQIPKKQEIENKKTKGTVTCGNVVHKAQKGDTLVGLAEKYYGNKQKWIDIYAANKEKIVKGSLVPGESIFIP